MRTGCLLGMISLALVSASFGAETDVAEVERAVEALLCSRAADGLEITRRFNAVLAIGPERVRPVLAPMLARCEHCGNPTSRYRARIESLAGLLAGGTHKAPNYLEGPFFVRIGRFVLLSVRFGAWKPESFFWQSPPPIERIVTGWENTFRPDGGKLLAAVLSDDEWIESEFLWGMLQESAGAAVGDAARADPSLAAALVERSEEATGDGPRRFLLWSALGRLGTPEAVAVLRRDLLRIVEGEYHSGRCRAIVAALHGAGGQALLFQTWDWLKKHHGKGGWTYTGYVEGDPELLERWEALRRSPTRPHLHALRYSLGWPGVYPSSFGQILMALMYLDEFTRTGPAELRETALRILEHALLEQPVGQMPWRGQAEPIRDAVRPDQPFSAPFQLARLKEDLRTGRLRHGADGARFRSPLVEHLSLDADDLPPVNVYVRAKRKGESLELVIQNQTDRPLCLNPSALAYGRARVWKITRDTENGAVEESELRLGLGMILGTYALSVSADDFVVVAPDGRWSTTIALPRGAPPAVEVMFHDSFRVRGRPPAPQLVEFTVRAE